MVGLLFLPQTCFIGLESEINTAVKFIHIKLFQEESTVENQRELGYLLLFISNETMCWKGTALNIKWPHETKMCLRKALCKVVLKTTWSMPRRVEHIVYHKCSPSCELDTVNVRVFVVWNKRKSGAYQNNVISNSRGEMTSGCIAGAKYFLFHRQTI